MLMSRVPGTGVHLNYAEAGSSGALLFGVGEVDYSSLKGLAVR